MTTVVHRNKAPFDVYIGRPGPYGNPYEIGRDGTRAEVIEKFRVWFARHPHREVLLRRIKGKVLGCWCKPSACHGDVLAELADKL